MEVSNVAGDTVKADAGSSTTFWRRVWCFDIHAQCQFVGLPDVLA